jgi:hypothetical protein
MKPAEGTLAILGIETIRILITGLAEETTATVLQTFDQQK